MRYWGYRAKSVRLTYSYAELVGMGLAHALAEVSVFNSIVEDLTRDFD